ncbi:MAG: tripartite tricarboxylate transporter substrate binding protein [Burkholderiales bacterium]
MGASGMNGGMARGVLAALCFVATQLYAQSWTPTSAVEFGVNCAPGCGPDRSARTLQKIWQEAKLIPAPVNVGNRPGGGGAVLYSYMNQKSDGHMIAIASGSLITNHIVGRGPSHNELTPIARLFGEYIAVAVRADSPIKNGRELIEALKKDPGALSIGVATSLGNSNHQGVAQALKASGIDVRKAKNVVFQSGANAITALLGGHVDIVPGSVGLWIPHVQSGANVRIVAVAAPQRLPGAMAQIPTWREQGINAVVSNWRGVVGARNMAPGSLAFWEGALRKAVASDVWKAELDRLLLMDEFIGAAEFRKYLDDQHSEIKALLTELGLVK